MPFYTFKCPSCCQEEEILQSIKSAKPICQRCADSSCGVHIVEMERVWQPTSKPQFKGSGFYETDYKTKDKPK
jgi:predicted nucleic acid-binding Zn ribbon protein